jgi:predicted aspartyl protease
LTLLLACGHAAPPADAPVVGHPDSFQSRVARFPPARVSAATPVLPARPTRSAPLKFELKGRYFPLPLVHGTIAGQPTWMLVDTGANSHVIASWLAKKAHLTMRSLGDVGTDHTGKSVTTYSVEHAEVVLDAWGPLDDGPMLVTDVPAPIEKLGIGAFISPQWLAEAGDAVVMDLVAEEMHTSSFDDAVTNLSGRGRAIAPSGGRICEDLGSAIKGLAYVLPASIDGHDVQLLLDTGAHRTDILTTAQAGPLLASRSVPSHEQMYAASGLVRTSLVKGAKVRVGEWSITADIDLIPGVADPVCPRDGVVSMDVLKSCVLVLGKKEMTGRCGH